MDETANTFSEKPLWNNLEEYKINHHSEGSGTKTTTSNGLATINFGVWGFLLNYSGSLVDSLDLFSIFLNSACFFYLDTPRDKWLLRGHRSQAPSSTERIIVQKTQGITELHLQGHDLSVDVSHGWNFSSCLLSNRRRKSRKYASSHKRQQPRKRVRSMIWSGWAAYWVRLWPPIKKVVE